MMASILITPGVSEQISPDIVVADSSGVAIGIYTEDGNRIPYGVVFDLERKTVAGNYQLVKTIDYGAVRLKYDLNVLLITTPGTYRVVRPDITEFGVNIGLQLG